VRSDNSWQLGDPHERVVNFHLLGLVAWDDCLVLQRRLTYALSADPRPQAVVLLAEHPEIITMGRLGSRSHIRLSYAELRRQQLAVRWLSRGGGCVLHAPGQLAVYPVLSLAAFRLELAEYLQLLLSVVGQTLQVCGVSAQTRGEAAYSWWGQSGMLATLGVTQRRNVVSQGAFINVSPAMSRFGYVDTAAPFSAAGEKTTMSSLVAERRLPVRMTNVRAALIEHLVPALACDRYNIHSGHPWLPDRLANCQASTARAS